MFASLKLTTVLAALAMLASGIECLAAVPCPDLQGKSAQELLQYLKGERSKLAPACVSYAIEQLGDQHYAPAIKVLISYMDYVFPMETIDVPRAPVPRVKRALSLMGKSVEPQLIEAIKAPATSDVVRERAAELVMSLHGPNGLEGITVLNQAAHATEDTPTRLKILDKVQSLVRFYCAPDKAAECMAAAMK